MKAIEKTIKEAIKVIAVCSDNNNVININKVDLEKVAAENGISYNDALYYACSALSHFLYIQDNAGVLLFKKEKKNKKYYPAISRGDFSFQIAGYGHYKVTYTSPVTGKTWTRTTNNMQLIDNTKGEESPKVKDLKDLKAMCKG